MITCKEDLMNTHIENDFGELRKTYIDKAIELGYNHQGNHERRLDWYDLPYIAINDSWDDAYVGQTADVTRRIRFSESKILTLSDLKPTPTKFVKVEESIFDLKGEFERGELYFSEWGEEKSFAKIKKEHRLMNNLNSGNVYRQVEIDWRDEVAEFTGLGKDFYTWVDCINDMYDFDFVEMCHLVASLTEKPEGV